MSITLEWSGSFVEANAFVQGAVNEVVQASGERVRQGAADRSRVDTGEMRDGWQFEFDGNGEGTVFNDVPYTVYNEYGTTRMSAQPMLTPAADAEEPDFLANLADIVGADVVMNTFVQPEVQSG